MNIKAIRDNVDMSAGINTYYLEQLEILYTQVDMMGRAEYVRRSNEIAREWQAELDDVACRVQ